VRPFATAVAAGLVLASVATGATSALTVVHTATNVSLGKILVSASGRTLYHYSSDRKNASRCTAACSASWPPLVVSAGAKPVAGPGVSASLLGTVQRPDGKVQVTYAGWPLYLYSGDRKAGDVNGQGEAGRWHALSPTGAVVTRAATGGSSSGTTSSGSSSGSTSGSTGSSSGSGSNTGGGGTGGTGSNTDCTANPGGYGCM
jgi:predicted lipoprotein with Yx(FWY)xxD motif